MLIHRLELPATDLASLKTFYGETLGLTITRADRAAVELMIGTSRLVFRSLPEASNGNAHFAFNIPRNLFREARDWLAGCTPLIHDSSGRGEFFHESWNAESVYFFDPTGNIAELIARHTLDIEREPPFGPAHFLSVSEVGIGVPDVRSAAMLIQERTQIEPYGQTGDTFAPMGTPEGLLILAAHGREWYPETGVPAAYLPIEATISHKMREFTILGAPEGIVLKA